MFALLQAPPTLAGLDALVPVAWTARSPAAAAIDPSDPAAASDDPDDQGSHAPGPLYATAAGGPGSQAQALLSGLVDVPAKRALMSLRTALMDAVSREKLSDKRPKLMGAVTAAQLRTLLDAFVRADRPVATLARPYLPLLQLAAAAIASMELGYANQTRARIKHMRPGLAGETGTNRHPTLSSGTNAACFPHDRDARQWDELQSTEKVRSWA